MNRDVPSKTWRGFSNVWGDSSVGHPFQTVNDTDWFVTQNNELCVGMAPFRNILLNILVCFAVFTYCSSHECYSETCRTEYVPHGPLVHCKFL